ncbi:MAG: CHAP domain-containing protein [Ruminococcaceae bacterium]|nr:CHAP domain-containing protein [Oscillospiraceae bacterium]
MKKVTLKALSCALALVVVLLCLTTAIAAQEGEIPKITHVKGRNAVSDSYAAGKYYNRLISLPYVQDNVTDLIAVACSQLGYMEGDDEEGFSGETAGSDNYTEFNYNMGDFGVGYGSGDYDWCASFVSYCLLQSRCTAQSSMSDWCRNHVADETDDKYDPNFANYVWREVGCQRWADNLISAGYYRASAANGGDYEPKAGDLIFFRWSPEKRIGHIGIVVYSDGEKVYTVEGNTSGGSTMVANGGGVYFKSYELDYSCIDGYGALPYAQNDGAEKIDYSGNNATAGLYVTTADKFLYSKASVESESITIPAYTVVKVVEVVEEGIGGMLRAVCEINGETVQGYVVNSKSERIVQISNVIPEPVPESFLPFDKTDGYVDGKIEGYTLNGESIDKSSAVEITGIGRIVLGATLDFEKDILRCGYFLDGKRTSIEWVDGCVSSAENGAQKCDIWADMYGLAEGTHTITFVVELENKVVPVLDTFEFSFFKQAEETEPEETEPEESETASETAELTDTSESALVTETQTTELAVDVGCGSAIGAFTFVNIGLAALVLMRRKRRE